jgi:hypothetical protein
VHAEYQHDCGWHPLEQRSRRRQATGARHRGIHHHDVRLRLHREPHGLIAVRGLADDLNLRIVFEHPAEAAPDQVVIVGEKNSNHWRFTIYDSRLHD